ncbi:unnamed protein product [Parajaminaea phylloscopi]
MASDLSLLPTEFTQAVESIRSRLPTELSQPEWGIICGSGLSTLGASLEASVEVQYETIPGFAHSSVQGHKNSLAFGFISDASSGRKVPVVAALGRFHLYEGYKPEQCVFPVRTFKALGCKAVIVTNASGGLNPSYPVGTIVALHDHLSIPTLTSLNPLVGPNFPLGPRFPPTSDAYDPALRLAVFRTAQDLGLLDKSKGKEEQPLREGVYAYVSGPSYESRAECKMLRSLGADCVGMSTVPEIIAARQCGLRVLSLSLVTNSVVVSPYASSFDALGSSETEDGAQGAQDAKEAANHEEVLQVGREKADVVKKLVEGTVLRVRL